MYVLDTRKKPMWRDEDVNYVVSYRYQRTTFHDVNVLRRLKVVQNVTWVLQSNTVLLFTMFVNIPVSEYVFNPNLKLKHE